MIEALDQESYGLQIVPRLNAESYAAAALENYFLERCRLQEILPHDDFVVSFY